MRNQDAIKGQTVFTGFSLMEMFPIEKWANELVAQLAAKHGQRYINVNAPLMDEQGRLKAEYTIEGMHIKPEGYRAIFDDVMAYVKE